MNKLKLIFGTLIICLTTLSFQNCGKFGSSSVGFLTESSSLSGPGLPYNSSLNFALRRLSLTEIDNSLNDILEDSTKPAAKILPPDATAPFDNDISTQLVSTPLIEGFENLALDITTRFLSDTTRRNRVLGCVGTLASDKMCMQSIIKKLSLKFFRRTQSDVDIEKWTNLALTQASTEQDFYGGVDFFLRFALMNPKFIYRFEYSGEGFSQSFRRAERLAFMLWGTTPDDELLVAASKDLLSTAEQVSDYALKMLNNPKAIRRVEQFHAEWLAYEKLGHAANLAISLKSEADAMVSKVIFSDQKAWVEIFKTTQSLVDGNTAQIYGLAAPATPTLVILPSNRKGILSTGAFLSAGAKFGDTSPTMRGKFVRNRLLCQEVPPPPPSINADEPPPAPPAGPNCKKNRYASHAAQGTSCFACHAQMDPVGFGLEQFDITGKFRAFEKNADGTDNTICAIDGAGSLAGVGNFNGPLTLTDLLVQSGDMENCMVQQYYHFIYGQPATVNDKILIKNIAEKLTLGGAKFHDVVKEIVTSKEFLGL